MSTIRMIAVLCVCGVALTTLRAQDTGRQLILSERVGADIDEAEASSFGLFRSYNYFQNAVFFRSPSDTYLCRVVTMRPGSLPETTWTTMASGSVLLIAERIQHYDELVKGTYTIGSVPPVIRYVGEDAENVDGVMGGNSGSPGSPGFEPKPLRSYPPIFRYAVAYPRPAVGIGVLSGVKVSAGNSYGQQLVDRMNKNRPFVLTDLTVELSRSWAASLFAGFLMGSEGNEETKTSARVAGFEAKYLFILSTVAISAGVGYMEYVADAKLEGFKYSAALRGPMIHGGMELSMTQNLGLSVVMRYVRSKRVEGTYKSLSDGTQRAELYLNATMADVRLTFYY